MHLLFWPQSELDHSGALLTPRCDALAISNAEMLSPATVSWRSLVPSARASLGTVQSRSRSPQCLIYYILDKETKKTLPWERQKDTGEGIFRLRKSGRGKDPAGWTLSPRTPPCSSRAPPSAFWATCLRQSHCGILPEVPCLFYNPLLSGDEASSAAIYTPGPCKDTRLVFRSFLHKASKENLNFGIS